jgi:hypothetical protein
MISTTHQICHTGIMLRLFQPLRESCDYRTAFTETHVNCKTKKNQKTNRVFLVILGVAITAGTLDSAALGVGIGFGL